VIIALSLLLLLLGSQQQRQQQQQQCWWALLLCFQPGLSHKTAHDHDCCVCLLIPEQGLPPPLLL
jgi:hypothetical protein